jgi:hypothetical protein
LATVALTPDVLTEAGAAPNYNGGLAIGNTYTIRNNGKTILYVKNAGAAPCTVTINAAKTVGSHALAAETVTIANGAEKAIGPFAHDVYDDINHDVSFTFSNITSVTVAVLQLPG